MSRYPYTYACDALREISGKQENGISPNLSRAQASIIRSHIAGVLGLDDEAVARAIADEYLRAHPEEIR